MARTDAERVEKLKEIRDRQEDRLHEVLASPKPTYTVDGQTFKWNEYVKMLREGIAEIDKTLVGLDQSGGLTMTQVFSG